MGETEAEREPFPEVTGVGTVRADVRVGGGFAVRWPGAWSLEGMVMERGRAHQLPPARLGQAFPPPLPPFCSHHPRIGVEWGGVLRLKRLNPQGPIPESHLGGHYPSPRKHS